jgi:hypothetical protein
MNSNSNKIGINNHCNKSGIKIHETKIKIDETKITSKIKTLDLNIDNYSLTDIFKLFNIKQIELDEETMKNAKKILLRTHPDKSGLEPNVFLFYQNAYNKLNSIHEFQNKSSKNPSNFNTEYEDTLKDKSNNLILNKYFEENKSLKDPSNFNTWFNEKFEKHKFEDENLYKGYGDWLKSNEGVSDIGNISKADMDSEFERHKKRKQSMTVYKGVNSFTPNTLGGTMIVSKNDNYTSGGLFNDGLEYTDLKQAYEESVIPVTNEDFNNIPKYNNVNDYKQARDNMNLTKLNRESNLNKLESMDKDLEKESIVRAYELAKQSEQNQKKQSNFWSELKQITGFK